MVNGFREFSLPGEPDRLHIVALDIEAARDAGDGAVGVAKG
jgi:hypothetical protein